MGAASLTWSVVIGRIERQIHVTDQLTEIPGGGGGGGDRRLAFDKLQSQVRRVK